MISHTIVRTAIILEHSRAVLQRKEVDKSIFRDKDSLEEIEVPNSFIANFLPYLSRMFYLDPTISILCDRERERDCVWCVLSNYNQSTAGMNLFLSRAEGKLVGARWPTDQRAMQTIKSIGSNGYLYLIPYTYCRRAWRKCSQL
jgi:hypothetical protein